MQTTGFGGDLAMTWRILAAACLLRLAALVNAAPTNYCVVEFVGAADPYHRAAARLAELRRGRLLSAEVAKLDALREVLRDKAPRYVAFVVRPEQFDENFAKAVQQLATRIDDDPFVDFAYGFITGDSPQTALALVDRGSARRGQQGKAEVAVAAVGTAAVTRSGIFHQQYALRKSSLPQLWGQIAGGENFPEQGRDANFIKSLLPQLDGRSIIIFAGHGYPQEVEGGPTARDLVGRDFTGSVVLNIACYTGVTGLWFDHDWSAGVRRKRTVPPEESFCLNVLRTGAAAYVAYTTPRPAGPELLTDVAALVADGLSVGEVRQRDYNRVVLAHIAQGHDGLQIEAAVDGARLEPQRNVVRDFLLPASVGGVLFGDPAYRPFNRRPGEHPVEVRSERNGDTLAITAQVAGQHAFIHCAEQLDRWGDTQSLAMRLLVREPIGRSYVAGVRVAKLEVAGQRVPHRLVWAVEEDAGERYLHAKCVFPQPGPDATAALMAGGVRGVFEVALTNDPSKASQQGVTPEAQP
jgi:hypothetical protein